MSARSARGGGTGRSGGYTKDELFGGSPGRGPASGRDEGKAGEGKDEGKDGGDRFVKAMGSIAVLGDLDDPHAQKLLRAHDEPISALATSVDGSLLASGQVGSTHIPGFAAPVVVWDRVSSALFKLRASRSVNILEFSDDMRFLAACGEDCVLYVWDATSGEVVFGKRYAKRLSLFQWIGAMDRRRRLPPRDGGDGRRRGRARRALLRRDAPAVAARVRARRHARRGHGARARSGGVYRASVPICTGGLLALALKPGGGADGRPAVFAGGGDGVVRRVDGYDMRWRLTAVPRARSRCRVGVPARRPGAGGVFASCASDGEVVVWDLSTYDAIATTKRACAAPKGRPADAAERPRRVAQRRRRACLAWVTDVAVVAGYGDCHVRCFSAADGALEWAIPTAHRRPVSAIACHVEQKLAYLFAEHHKGVTGLVVDAADPRLFHSGGLDCAVFTHDLRSEKRTVSHMMREGAFTGLSQRKDSERELITCDANGRVLFWDCDVPEPILGVSVDGTTVACVAVSPSGRYFVLCRDEMLTIFELDANSATAHPKPIAEGWAHSANVTKVQWSPDERQLVSIGADSCICIWNLFGTSD
ncbi:WD repeat-containing protein [Aureococcus anophagefferens]|nr:WD repeat-containing protein [Aureococcus anophagefferens]